MDKKRLDFKMEVVSQLSPVTKAFLAGSLSGTCSTLLFQPLDLVKTRQQVGGRLGSRSMLGIARSIVVAENVTGLWRGLWPSVCRTVPGVGIYFSSVHWMRSQLEGRKPTTVQALLIGASARAIAAFSMIPITVLKTRYESGRFTYLGVGSGLGHIIRTEGLTSLYRGLVPTLVRDVPFSALYLASYEMLKKEIPSRVNTSSSTCHIMAGLGAGFLASLVTHPADVVKTHMQVSDSKTRLSRAVVETVTNGGIKGFMAGLAPRLVRRTAMAALAWTVYEKMLSAMALKN